MKKIEIPQPKLTVLKKQESTLNIDFTNSIVEEFFKLEGYSENTIRAYKRAITRFKRWKELSWDSYNRKDLADYREYLNTLNLKSASIHQELSALKKLFAWLTVEEIIERDPALALKPPKITSSIDSTEIPLEVLSEVESNLNSPRDFALYYVLLHGLRRQEITKLKIKDYLDKAIAIREAKWGSDRVVPLLPKAISALNDYLDSRGGITNIDKDEALFLSLSNRCKNEALTSAGIYYLVTHWVRTLPDHLTPHDFRHHLCQNLIDGDINPLLARQITGHKSDRAFERYSKEALRKKADSEFRDLNFLG